MRIAREVGEEIAVLDGARVGLSDAGRWLVIDHASEIWRSVGDLAPGGPRGCRSAARRFGVRSSRAAAGASRGLSGRTRPCRARGTGRRRTVISSQFFAIDVASEIRSLCDCAAPGHLADAGRARALCHPVRSRKGLDRKPKPWFRRELEGRRPEADDPRQTWRSRSTTPRNPGPGNRPSPTSKRVATRRCCGPAGWPARVSKSRVWRMGRASGSPAARGGRPD